MDSPKSIRKSPRPPIKQDTSPVRQPYSMTLRGPRRSGMIQGFKERYAPSLSPTVANSTLQVGRSNGIVDTLHSIIQPTSLTHISEEFHEQGMPGKGVNDSDEYEDDLSILTPLSKSSKVMDETITSKDAISGQQDYTGVVENLQLNPFQFMADQISVANVKAQVEDLNNTIDNMIMSILDCIKPKPMKRVTGQNYRASITETKFSVISKGQNNALVALYDAMVEYSRNESSKGRILDWIMHEKICSLLYTAYFEGKNFWGTNKEHNKHNEELYFYIKKNEPTLARKWQSMTADAEFGITKGDAKNVPQEISSAFKGIIVSAYCQGTTTHGIQYHDAVKVVDIHTQLIQEITDRARNLSLRIQRDMLFSQVKLLYFSPRTKRDTCRKYQISMRNAAYPDVKSKGSDSVLGTIRFGLNLDIDENGKRKKLLIPLVITESDVKWCLADEDEEV
ncbi:hypothetical protein JR316_0012269 [Psilocybe cubensis]|uniref:Uncharacterized protein n=2 Tax=Psilocybe cubensis TaxID=181762 RepID=A0A8H7XNW5_PSICU|nr:hypothetical protein JR316_0012269 [Psilocybe cubensis]KAH9475158.1 hypothetical protein JR316_0012269 [Psilocybe cubensis]